MANRFTEKDIIKIANLARIHLTDNEIKRYTEDLDKVVEYANSLKEINTDNIEAMISPLSTDLPLREDTVKPSLSQYDALKGASQIEAGHFKVPRTVE